ncbi:MAG TPA: hypothetical protein VFW33_11070 [Gemmataceae bacterium]|nr:hypothetical protein [Gemmataceae bacterium]
MENEPRKVCFQVTDLVNPQPARVLLELFQHLQLEGEVAGETTDGKDPFLVVRVPGLSEPVIVPLAKTWPAEPAACGTGARR